MADPQSTSPAYSEFTRLSKHDAPGLQEISTFSRTRIELRCADMTMDHELMALPDDALALFWRLMPYAPWGVPVDLEVMARMAHCSPRKTRRLWPLIESFFVRDGESWRLAERDWHRPYLLPVIEGRVPLRHLFKRLADYWGRCCVYCGDRVARLAIEHIVPRVRGGSDEVTNLTLACHSCNSRKGTKTAAEFGHPHIHDRAQGIH